MGVTATLAGTRAFTGSDIVKGVLGGILSLAVSPGGVVLAWYSGGWSHVGRVLKGATANPRASCLHYLAVVRRIPPEVALRLAMAAAVFAVLLGVLGAAGLLWWWDPELWVTLIAVIRFATE